MAMNQSHEKLRHFVNGKQWGVKMLSFLFLYIWVYIHSVGFGLDWLRYKSPNNSRHFQSDQREVDKNVFGRQCEEFDSWFHAYEICPRCQIWTLRLENKISMATYSSFRGIPYNSSITVCTSTVVCTFDISTAFDWFRWNEIHTSYSFVLFPFASLYVHVYEILILTWPLSFLWNVPCALNITFT